MFFYCVIKAVSWLPNNIYIYKFEFRTEKEFEFVYINSLSNLWQPKSSLECHWPLFFV